MPARLQEQLSVVGAAFSRANNVTTTIITRRNDEAIYLSHLKRFPRR